MSLSFHQTTPAEGAVRSYSCWKGRFVVSLHNRRKKMSEDAWSVYDTTTEAYVKVWSRREAVRLIVRLVTPSRNPDHRFLVLPRIPTPWAQEDCVLYDRNTGRHWMRYLTTQLHEDIRGMQVLAQHLPESYYTGTQQRSAT